MRFRYRENRVERQIVIREFFAFLPEELNGEIRWFEKVKIEGYWWKGALSGIWYWEPIKFID